MKIVSWNCNGGLWKKFKYLSTLEADIYVIQECENPILSKYKEYKDWASNALWIGDNKNKGLGIFARNEIHIEKLNWSDEYEGHLVKYFLPVLINKKTQFLAVWAHHNNSPTFGYVGQIWKYLQINSDKISETIILGDFNSNKIWDKWDRWWNHTDVLNILNDKGIYSLYHEFYGEEQGEETRNTFYLHRNRTKGYHIDYIFAPKSYSAHLTQLSIGDLSWLDSSDHMPITISVNDVI